MIYNDWYWLNQDSQTFLSRGYIPQGYDQKEWFKAISEKAEKILNRPGFSDKFLGYLAKGYYLLPTPVITNFLTEKESPISCFSSFSDDTIESILYTQAEIGTMSKIGGGTSVYLNNLRPRGSSISGGGETGGPVHFAELFQSVTNVVSQRSRRGKVVTWLDVEHEDIEEFLTIRDEGSVLQTISFGVCIGRDWLKSMREGNPEKRAVWAKIVKKKFETGYPYIMYKDNANDSKPQVYKDKNMDILSSQLCTEVFLPTTVNESFVCCLLGMNALHFDEWEHTDAVETGIYFMDTLITDFISKSKDNLFLQRAVKFAEGHRSLGMGLSMLHSYYQSKNIAFESMEAKMVNVKIFKTLKDQATAASEKMALEYGKPEILKEEKYKMRHTTVLAVAPNTSSAFIVGQGSQSIEPFTSNYYIKDVAKMKYTVKNIFLENLLREKDKNTEEIWDSILKKNGSVQHLSFLSEHEKKVFRTFGEISQMELVIQASARQKFIDQGQSLNIYVPYGTPARDVSVLMLKAEELGLKSLYYQLNENSSQVFSRSILECESCAA